MTEKPAQPDLGYLLSGLKSITINWLFQTAELATFAENALIVARNYYHGSAEGTFKFQYPVGVRADGSLIPGQLRDYPREEVVAKYEQLATVSLAVSGVYQVVTTVEYWIAQLVVLIVGRYPKKLGRKRQIDLGTLLGCKTIESVHQSIAESFINHVMYKSPAEYADEIREVLGCDLKSLPPFWRFIEVKATRDVWIHGGGTANDIYAGKAGSHARVAAGRHLPITVPYFLAAYETALQPVESVHKELEDTWPPPPDPAQLLLGSDQTEPKAQAPEAGPEPS